MLLEPLRPARGGFLRPFGCGWFIRQFLLGYAPEGSPVVDPDIGAPQAFADLKTQTGAKFLEKNDNLELWIKSPSDWENLRPALQPVLASIVEGWKAKRKEQIIQ